MENREMGDHLARGEEYERKAEKKLNSCGLWGSKLAKVEGAADLFFQAAYCFKLAESWDRAGSAYMESAKCQLKGKNTYGAILTFVRAADCYKKTSSKEAITCLEHAVNVLIHIGSIGRAARYYKDIGELYESEQNLERAVDYFERAADLFQSEELILFVHECKEKVAQFAAQLDQYQKATEIYEEIALYYLQEGLKFVPRKCLRHAGLCQLSKVDIVAIENALACYQELDPTFSETRECRFLKDIADAIDKVDVVKLTDTVKEFTNITPLVKAYTSRVGSGPFQTELFGNEGDMLRSAGLEFGTTTGCPRHCGWLDIVALKYHCQINGFSSLNLTKLDVLSYLPEIHLGVAYTLPDGTPIKSFPADLDLLEQLKVEYEVLPGWKCDISSIRNYSDLPMAARQYVERVEELVGVPIHYSGVGPGRDALIFK